jgi:hypothetical protein
MITDRNQVRFAKMSVCEVIYREDFVMPWSRAV